MWIQINRDIFENSDIKGLNYIFQILSWYPQGSIPRYKLFIDLDDIKVTNNYKQLTTIETNFDEVIEAQFNEFITLSSSFTSKDYYITNLSGKCNFNIEESITFFSQPVSIILENNKNDSYFIQSIIHHFDTINKVVLNHLDNGWIKFENAGGCSNVENFLEGFLSSFEKLSYKNNRQVSDYFRGLIILDSDKEFKTQPIKNVYNTLISRLSSKGIFNIHILDKRMMENYMPDEVFQELKVQLTGKQRYAHLIDWINVYLNLNDEQKDYLKYYDGFSTNLANQPAEIKSLYNNQSLTNFGYLEHGFKYEDFKNKFPLLYIKSSRVNKHTLNSRAKSNELGDILEKISKLL